MAWACSLACVYRGLCRASRYTAQSVNRDCQWLNDSSLRAAEAPPTPASALRPGGAARARLPSSLRKVVPTPTRLGGGPPQRRDCLASRTCLWRSVSCDCSMVVGRPVKRVGAGHCATASGSSCSLAVIITTNALANVRPIQDIRLVISLFMRARCHGEAVTTTGASDSPAAEEGAPQEAKR